jgi:hypothetical protein
MGSQGLSIATLVVVSLILFTIVSMMLLWTAQGAVVIEQPGDSRRRLT